MEAEAEAEARPHTWAEAQVMKERLSVIRKKICDLSKLINDEEFFSGLSEAEREAKQDKAEEERLLLTHEYDRLHSVMTDPDFLIMSEAERAAEAERLRQEGLEEARRLKEAGDFIGALRREAEARVTDFDPKQEGMYYNRLCYPDFETFDHDEESPLGPMRFTETAFKGKQVACLAVNILSVKIACLDVGFPIKVYGTVIARDSTDHKCVYLFRRSRDCCQLIKSKDQPLILTGPKRGLALLDYNYVETDLKIKDHEGQDRELSKGMLSIRGVHRPSDECEVEREALATRLSTVVVKYAVVVDAVEATLAVQVLQGKFQGTITAHTTSIKKRFMLYNSKVAGGDGHGGIRLRRRVVSVCVNDMLIIEAKTGDGKFVRRIEFTPRGNSGDEDVITVGPTKMRVMVAWSIMDP